MTPTRTGLRYGVGAQMFADGANGVRIDYTREHLNGLHDPVGYFSADDNANVWSVAFTHKF